MCVGVVALSGLSHVSAHAIDVHPTAEQVQTALDQGKEAAQKRSPPDTFYVRLQPSEVDVTQVLKGQTMLVSTIIFGNVPNFAVDSYMVFDQGGTTIKPVTVRFDGFADRSAAWPESPRFKAKVIASFNYADFDPQANTTITVFPANGGEVSFRIDFSKIH